MHQGRTKTLNEAFACGLGFFSIAIGVAELVAPRWIARVSGSRVSANMIRAFGMREIATGVGLLMAAKRGPWLWGRVAGDALDIAAVRNPAAIAALAGITALDVAAASCVTREENRPPQIFDYSRRSGFSRSVDQVRGIARIKRERAPGSIEARISP
jgi:hypothetical protein